MGACGPSPWAPADPAPPSLSSTILRALTCLRLPHLWALAFPARSCHFPVRVVLVSVSPPSVPFGLPTCHSGPHSCPRRPPTGGEHLRLAVPMTVGMWLLCSLRVLPTLLTTTPPGPRQVNKDQLWPLSLSRGPGMAWPPSPSCVRPVFVITETWVTSAIRTNRSRLLSLCWAS